MPASKNQSRQHPQPSPSSGPKATAKYTNKDGTKYISVPKSAASTPPTQPSPTTAAAPPQSPTAPEKPAPVNRKKQKRRAKAAAKLAAEQADMSSSNGVSNPSAAAIEPPLPLSTSQQKIQSPTAEDFGDETESEHEQPLSYVHHANGTASKSKKGRKKKKKGGDPEPDLITHSSGIAKDKIWNTSGPEERERIKQFWLGLGEEDRKSLVKVEKDAVLRKMKEQQKHTCSCSVCGRKRTAIEEELEGLYDAYYQELEHFANRPHEHPDTSHMFAATKKFGGATGLHNPNVLPAQYSNHYPSRGRIVEHVDNEEDEDDIDDEAEYSEEEEELEDEDEEDEEDEPLEMPRDSYQNDFFNFGQSLTVKGGILTVADDLLKNDGKKFIEMMEQLAERRMAREEDAKDHFANPPYGHPPQSVHAGAIPSSQNQSPPEEDDYDDEEEEGDEEYDSQEEDYDDEELQEDMTEEQRMEEGRRMFQIFAARMFEQRVLTAYREKVARERQDKLLEELEQEDLKKTQQAAKKAKEAQKKKDKAAQKKAAQLEEKARKEAAKAEEETRRQAIEKAKADEAQRKAEEKRRKKDAQKKADEEERLRKEAERQRRAHEQREKQAEQERRAREQKDKERKAKEERQRKELEARELKERETRERREKHEKDKREKELRAAQAKADRDAKEKQKQEGKVSQKATAQGTPILAQPSSKKQQGPATMPAIPHHPGQPSHHASPQISVATPVLPKAPTPMKPRAVSHEVARSVSQTSHPGSGLSQTDSSQPLTPVHSSPGPIRPPSKASSHGPNSAGPLAQPASPLPGGVKSPPGFPQPGPFANMGMPPLGMQFPPGLPPMPAPGFGRPMHDPMMPPMHAPFGPSGMSGPPGLPNFSGRHFPFGQAPPPGLGADMPNLHHGFPVPDSHAVPRQGSSHSRQPSASFESTSPDSQGPTGARMVPIGRPPSVAQGHRRDDLAADIDDVSKHLGSSALLGDSEDASFNNPLPFRRGTGAPGSAFPAIDSAFGTSPLNNSGWGLAHHQPFPPPQAAPASQLWGSTPSFNHQTPIRSSQPRTLMIRQMLIQSCRELQNHAADVDGYIDFANIRAHIDSINTSAPVTETEILDICETEGNTHNGGGTFNLKQDNNGKVRISFEPDAGSASSAISRNVGAPGQMTSPVVGAQPMVSRF